MDNPRPEKVAVVDEVRERLTSSSAAILTEYRGLKVGELADLRRMLRDAGGEYKVYKNTLVRFAVRDLGIDELEAMLVGPTAIAFVDGDAVTVAKALRDFSRTNPNLVVKGGLLGHRLLDARDAGALADIAPREVLLARFAGSLAAPMQRFASLLSAIPRSFAYGLKALIDSLPPDPVAAPAAEAPAAEALAAPEAPAPDASPTPAAAAPTGEPGTQPIDGGEAAPDAVEVSEAVVPEASAVEPSSEETVDDSEEKEQ